ncbi:MAG TPA: hypothetical protein VMN76_01165 [Acidobacteriota bacterium]|nr:hypothetical protein [Acidobacteriota bacterium]
MMKKAMRIPKQPAHVRFQSLRRFGFGLVAASLIILSVMGSAPELNFPPLIGLGFTLLGGGVASLALYSGVKIIQYSFFKNRTAFCLRCGWKGTGTEWFSGGCCPECESPQVALGS